MHIFKCLYVAHAHAQNTGAYSRMDLAASYAAPHLHILYMLIYAGACIMYACKDMCTDLDHIAHESVFLTCWIPHEHTAKIIMPCG